ncbi:MAG: exodeoxyribonuclease VII large subunit [Clostridia bacterium]|nr:exodeoxyribonuclease VII large subunit [Clostridia bacterium]
MLLLSVGQLNEYVKGMLESNDVLSDVWVRGEISNFTNHYKTGHYYFSLKDAQGAIGAVMFRSYAARLPFVPQNGMKVLLHGRVSLYVPGGQYQINADSMQPDGVGALYLAFEQLKAKLQAEGLFDQARKKPLPRIPSRIGIITSPTGAAIHDMINILGRRFPSAEILLYPALVQGAGAPASLIAGMQYFNQRDLVDLIIIGRGGGSMEDLWAFNDEQLARTVAASRLPVISAVGHESDFTVCDFVADRRAPTPSAAAELAVPDAAELVQALRSTEDRMRAALSLRVAQKRERVAQLAKSRVLTSPDRFLDDCRQRVGDLALRLDRAAEHRLTCAKGDFARTAARLDALNPLAILTRGYAVVRAGETPVRSIEELRVGTPVRLTLADGEATAEITEIHQRKA